MSSTETSSNGTRKTEKNKINSLTVLPPVIIEESGSPCSSPYFRKLPPLSPRSMKMIDPNFRYSPDHRSKSPADLTSRGSTESGASTTSSLEWESHSSTNSEKNHFNFERKHSEYAESNTDDIDFFLQVVTVFREYIGDQIALLENQFSETQQQQQILQKEQRRVEAEGVQQESRLNRDATHLVSLLHRKHAELKDILKKQNRNAVGRFQKHEEECRRNMKVISGILSFAKQLRNECSESMKENAVKELKQKLSIINDMAVPKLSQTFSYPTKIDVVSLEKVIESISLQYQLDEKMSRDDETEINHESKVFITAATSSDDVTKSNVTVRWRCQDKLDTTFAIKWTFTLKGKLTEKIKEGITGSCYVIDDLPSNCDVTVRLRQAATNSPWSEAAYYHTLSTPPHFSFDPNTAHVKLKLSSDLCSVSYRGDEGSSPKSPERFTFALNILGNIPFFSGSHYWEIRVNGDGWAIGVAYRGIPRNSWLGSNDSSWILHHNPAKREYKTRHAGHAWEVDMKLPNPKSYLKRMGVYINVEAGIIKFVDPLNERVLHMFCEDRFAEPLCAAANPFYHGRSLTLVSGLEIPSFLRG